MVGTLEADDCKKIIDAHVMNGEKESSWAVTYKNYWRIILEYTELNHTINAVNEKQNKRWKRDISSSRYRRCTHDRNEEESFGSR